MSDAAAEDRLATRDRRTCHRQTSDPDAHLWCGVQTGTQGRLADSVRRQLDRNVEARPAVSCDISFLTIYLPIYRNGDGDMFNGNIWVGCSPPGGKSWGGFDSDFMGWFGGGRRGRGGPFRGGRMFE